MSGICGIYSPRDPALVNRDLLEKMRGAIGHRGRAAHRSFVDNNSGIAIGHVFAPAFQAPHEQIVPNWHDGEDYVAALDGAVFNSEDFLPTNWPQRFEDRDTAAAVEYLRQSRSDFPERLDGHFSLAIWDKKQRQLWLVRDALGGKPLYYCHLAGKGLVLFASELKGILAHSAVHRCLDREALTAYLTFGYVPAPLSILKGIHKVFPGEILRFNAAGQVSRRQYWQVPAFEPRADDLGTFAARLREQLIQTVAKHVEGCQRLGVFFSAGIESTIVLGILKLLDIPELHTFTMGFHTDAKATRLYEDLCWAERVAHDLAAKHHQILIERGHNPLVLLPRILRQFDEPLVTPNCYSKYFLSESAHQAGVNSCVTGSNAESLFESDWQKTISKMHKAIGDSASDDERILFCRMRLFHIDEQVKLLAEPVTGAREVALEIIHRYRQGIKADYFGDLVDGALLRMQGAEKGIAVQDHTSVLNEVEVRHPFYDTQLVRFANTIPARFKGKDSDAMWRAVLIEGFRDILPENIIKRKKVGFPSYYWNHGEVEDLKQRLLSPAGLKCTGLFRPEAVTQVLEADRTSTRKSAGKRTWALLVMQAWFEMYMNGNDEIFANGNGRASTANAVASSEATAVSTNLPET